MRFDDVAEEREAEEKKEEADSKLQDAPRGPCFQIFWLEDVQLLKQEHDEAFPLAQSQSPRPLCRHIHLHT